jgi:hypothetical protein
VERALYLGALIAGQPVFIGVWFAAKVVGTVEWHKRNGEEPKAAGEPASPRVVYQRFLILAGASLASAAGGWAIYDGVVGRSWVEPLLPPLALVILTGWLVQVLGGPMRLRPWRDDGFGL